MACKAATKEVLTIMRSDKQHLKPLCDKIAAKNEYRGLKSETLRKAVARALAKKTSIERQHGLMRLTDEDELIWVAILLTCDARCIPLRCTDLIHLVTVAHGFDAGFLTEHWYRCFMKRHDNALKVLNARHTDSIPYVEKLRSSMVRFLDEFEILQQRISYHPDFVINADETPVGKKQLHRARVIASVNAAKSSSITIPGGNLISVLPFVAASGKVWFTVLIFKGVSKSTNGAKTKAAKPIWIKPRDTRCRGRWPLYYASTANGYMTSDLWIHCMGILVSTVRPQRQFRDILLFVDHHSTHHNAAAIHHLLKTIFEHCSSQPRQHWLYNPLTLTSMRC
jgi:hypothetical protein